MGFFKKENQSVYSQLKNQAPSESTRYRDVYETQQIKRSRIGTAGSMAIRNAIVAICSVLIFIVAWFFVGGAGFLVAQIHGSGPETYVIDKQTIFDDAYQTAIVENKKKFSDGNFEPPAEDFENDEFYQDEVIGSIDLNGVSVEYRGNSVMSETWRYKYDVNNDGLLETVYAGSDEVFNTADDYHAYEFSGVTRNIFIGEDLRFGTADDIVILERVDLVPPLSWYFIHSPDGWFLMRFLIAFGSFGIVYGIMGAYMKKNWEAQNTMYDTADINQWENDQHIQVPEEIQENYDWFPDVGAHAPIQVSSLISHMALTNKGLKQIDMTRRAEKDMKDENGDIVYYKGEALLDDNGDEITSKKPMIDEKFMDELWTASELPMDKTIRRKFDPSKILYNPGNKNRDKLKDAETVADMINKYWTFPSYEPQRPGGAYIVDTQPVNTMVLAITRAGKGQTIIEPTLDMWTREEQPNNMIINDPKGELLVKFYVRGTVRGFQIVQFNLINAMKTDIYNPLGIAAEAAREGDFTKCALYVENIADVFFPLDGGDDPVWPNAANNAFKRAAYGLIDFYLEEEKELRRKAEREKMSAQVLETKIDQMWGKVTLYNCYQLFVQLTAKKLKNPVTQLDAKSAEIWEKYSKLMELLGYKYKDDIPEEVMANLNPVITHPQDKQFVKVSLPDSDLTDEQLEAVEIEATELREFLSDEGQEKMKKEAEFMSTLLWEDKPESDLLTLYFNATAGLPRNQMRTLINNANNALRAMAGAEKMLASVYGIAITAMVRRVHV